MDSLSLHFYADKVRNLPQEFHLVFNACHIILCVLSVRKDAGKGSASKNPLATWLACVVASFAGSLIVNPIIGKPMLAALADEFLISVTTLVYLAVFFSPGDVVYTVLKLTPVYATICVLKEILRAKKVCGGLKEGLTIRPDGFPFLVPILIATIKGNGSGFMSPITRLILGSWRPFENEILKCSVTTKLCAFAAVVLTVMGIGNDLAYLALVGLFITVKLSTVFGEPVDPFKPVESIVIGILSTISGSSEHAHAE